MDLAVISKSIRTETAKRTLAAVKAAGKYDAGTAASPAQRRAVAEAKKKLPKMTAVKETPSNPPYERRKLPKRAASAPEYKRKSLREVKRVVQTRQRMQPTVQRAREGAARRAAGAREARARVSTQAAFEQAGRERAAREAAAAAARRDKRIRTAAAGTAATTGAVGAAVAGRAGLRALKRRRSVERVFTPAQKAIVGVGGGTAAGLMLSSRRRDRR